MKELFEDRLATGQQSSTLLSSAAEIEWAKRFVSDVKVDKEHKHFTVYSHWEKQTKLFL